MFLCSLSLCTSSYANTLYLLLMLFRLIIHIYIHVYLKLVIRLMLLFSSIFISFLLISVSVSLSPTWIPYPSFFSIRQLIFSSLACLLSSFANLSIFSLFVPIMGISLAVYYQQDFLPHFISQLYDDRSDELLILTLSLSLNLQLIFLALSFPPCYDLIRFSLPLHLLNIITCTTK